MRRPDTCSAVTATFPEALRPGVPIPGEQAVRHWREHLLDVGRIHAALSMARSWLACPAPQ
ncbi:hypothetical protein ACFU7Y_28040 [Kitasatospora sp. NPDC057542]|uniref:hypothetical protein n=1 Tax=Kitasatospora sp. NPDC057542 TaxID=3346162 RepID=UPI003692CC55